MDDPNVRPMIRKVWAGGQLIFDSEKHVTGNIIRFDEKPVWYAFICNEEENEQLGWLVALIFIDTDKCCFVEKREWSKGSHCMIDKMSVQEWSYGIDAIGYILRGTGVFFVQDNEPSWEEVRKSLGLLNNECN